MFITVFHFQLPGLSHPRRGYMQQRPDGTPAGAVDYMVTLLGHQHTSVSCINIHATCMSILYTKIKKA